MVECRRRKLEPTLRADLTGCVNHCLALLALLSRSHAVTARHFILGLYLIDKPVPLDILAVIQNQAVFLAVSNPRPTSHHLNVKARRGRSPNQSDQINWWVIEPRGQHVHVNQAAQLTALEVCNGLLAHLVAVCACHYANCNIVGLKFISQHISVVDPTAEHQPAFAIRSKPHNLFYSRPHQLWVRRRSRKLALNELTAPLANTLQIYLLHAALADHRRQVALLHQHGHWDVVGNPVKDRALALMQIPAVQSVWRGRKPNHLHVWVAHLQISDKPIVSCLSILGQQVRLIDQNQIRSWHNVIRPLPDRLDACKRDWSA